jgi:hypothetical protein
VLRKLLPNRRARRAGETNRNRARQVCRLFIVRKREEKIVAREYRACFAHSSFARGERERKKEKERERKKE